MSSPVQIATTPGAAARICNVDRQNSCMGNGERTTRMCSWLGNETSAANNPRPVTSGGSSSRVTEAPTLMLSDRAKALGLARSRLANPSLLRLQSAQHREARHIAP